jgi:hypothetical protein
MEMFCTHVVKYVYKLFGMLVCNEMYGPMGMKNGKDGKNWF